MALPKKLWERSPTSIRRRNFSNFSDIGVRDASHKLVFLAKPRDINQSDVTADTVVRVNVAKLGKRVYRGIVFAALLKVDFLLQNSHELRQAFGVNLLCSWPFLKGSVAIFA
jgi:hypothetical protein